jgi:hypothetical protein
MGWDQFLEIPKFPSLFKDALPTKIGLRKNHDEDKEYEVTPKQTSASVVFLFSMFTVVQCFSFAILRQSEFV